MSQGPYKWRRVRGEHDCGSDICRTGRKPARSKSRFPAPSNQTLPKLPHDPSGRHPFGQAGLSNIRPYLPTDFSVLCVNSHLSRYLTLTKTALQWGMGCDWEQAHHESQVKLFPFLLPTDPKPLHFVRPPPNGTHSLGSSASFSTTQQILQGIEDAC